ncbi:MAG: DUF998 domain-containing protein [Candidatus Micrarchaeia archaeon]
MGKDLRLILGGLAGILAAVLALSCVFLAVNSYPAFSWQGNALSDLGSMNQQPTRSLFNYGLIAGGILALGFAYGLKKYLQGWKGEAWAALVFSLDMLALIGIGVFPGDFMPETHVHYAVSVAFFALFPIAGFLITYGLLKTGRKKFAFLTLILALIGALVWIAHWTVYPFGTDVAIPEIVAALCAGAWVVIAGALMVKKGLGKTDNGMEKESEAGKAGPTGENFFSSVIE